MPSPSLRPSFNLLRRRRSEDPSPSSSLDPAAYGSASAFATAYRPAATRRPIPPMGDPPPYASLGLARTRTPPPPAVHTTAAEAEKITYEPGPELPFLLGVLVTVLVLYGMGWLANGSGDECAGLRADIALVYERVEAIQNKL